MLAAYPANLGVPRPAMAGQSSTCESCCQRAAQLWMRHPRLGQSVLRELYEPRRVSVGWNIAKSALTILQSHHVHQPREEPRRAHDGFPRGSRREHVGRPIPCVALFNSEAADGQGHQSYHGDADAEQGAMDLLHGKSMSQPPEMTLTSNFSVLGVPGLSTPLTSSPSV